MCSARFSMGKEHKHKIFWIGKNVGVGGEGIFLAEK